METSFIWILFFNDNKNKALFNSDKVSKFHRRLLAETSVSALLEVSVIADSNKVFNQILNYFF